MDVVYVASKIKFNTTETNDKMNKDNLMGGGGGGV